MEDNSEVNYNLVVEVEEQLRQAELGVIEFNYHRERMEYFGEYGVKWMEELGAAIDGLTQARDILQGVFDGLVEAHSADKG